VSQEERLKAHFEALYIKAKLLVVEHQKASTSFLQRRLWIGYTDAARLVDALEERGIVGPARGPHPREILQGVSCEDLCADSEGES